MVSGRSCRANRSTGPGPAGEEPPFLFKLKMIKFLVGHFFNQPLCQPRQLLRDQVSLTNGFSFFASFLIQKWKKAPILLIFYTTENVFICCWIHPVNWVFYSTKNAQSTKGVAAKSARPCWLSLSVKSSLSLLFLSAVKRYVNLIVANFWFSTMLKKWTLAKLSLKIFAAKYC